MKPDKWWQSYRLYAAALALLGLGLNLFGVEFSPEAQATTAKVLRATAEIVVPLAAGVLPIVSKIREAKKLKQTEREKENGRKVRKIVG